MVAFLGMGLLGSNFVRAMINKKEKVRVWNRTAEKAKALEQYGAIACTSPAEAVQGADTVHLTLKDDASVNEVLEQAAGGPATGKPVAIPIFTRRSLWGLPTHWRARVSCSFQGIAKLPASSRRSCPE